MRLKSHGRVYIIRPSARPFTFALPVRLTAKTVPVIMNGELREMQSARKQRQETR